MNPTNDANSSPVTGPFENRRNSGSYSPGDTIGPYKLLELLGEGGMGDVWLAEQSEPVRRRVALKLIKAGMDTQHVLARFEAERQALALMDHANIARVLDAGQTSVGRPYFVMELVKGMPLTVFCDHEKLSLRERLELFMPICQAVQHAHQKGVIHRDLKPSNILVGMSDGRPVPKVIDFGVAKATSEKLTERTLHTAVGSMVGTPAYMAPEQAEINNDDIDTRADIYSLGVVLYELLAGSPPFTAKHLRDAAFDEMLRVIREVEPPKPSTKLSSSDELPSIAARRRVEPKKLAKSVKGDLDWIVMKCLEKERAQRYESANGLAMDIQRYLADEPVLAGPPSFRYRLRKFVRRHRRPVIAAGLVLLVVMGLMAGLAGTTAVAVRNLRLARAAEANARQKEEEAIQERTRADEEKAIAAAVSDFLQYKLLSQSSTTSQADALLQAGHSPADARLDPPISVLLNRAAAELASDKIESQFPKQPLVQAEILRTIGNTYRGVGNLEGAISHLQRSRDQYAAALGADHLETLRLQIELGAALIDAGRLAEATRLLEQARDLAATKFGADHSLLPNTLHHLGIAYQAAGKLPEAIRLYDQASKGFSAQRGGDHPFTLSSLNNLAEAYLQVGRFPEAIPIFEQIREMNVAKLGAEHPRTLTTLHNLASAYEKGGRLREAIPIYEQVRQFRAAKLGAYHPLTLVTINNLAMAYRSAGQLPEAISLLEQVRDAEVVKLGADHLNTLTTMNNLAGAYQANGKLAATISIYEKVREVRTAKLGADHPATLNTLNNLARAHHTGGNFSESIRILEQVRDVASVKLGADHPLTLTALGNLSSSYRAVNRLAEAAEVLEQAATAIEKQNFQHEFAEGILANTATCYESLNQFEKAESWRRKWLAVVKERAGLESPDYSEELTGLGFNLIRQKRFSDAEPFLRESLAIRERKEPQVWTTFYTKFLLGGSFLFRRQYSESEPLLVEAYKGMKACRGQQNQPGGTPPFERLTEALSCLIRLYDEWDRPDEAATWRAELAAVNAAEKPLAKPKP